MGGGAPGAARGAFGSHAKYLNQPDPPGMVQSIGGASALGAGAGALGGRRQNFSFSISAGLSASLGLNLILDSCRRERLPY